MAGVEKEIRLADWYRFMCFLAGKTPSAKRIRDYLREERKKVRQK